MNNTARSLSQEPLSIPEQKITNIINSLPYYPLSNEQIDKYIIYFVTLLDKPKDFNDLIEQVDIDIAKMCFAKHICGLKDFSSADLEYLNQLELEIFKSKDFSNVITEELNASKSSVSDALEK